MDITIANTTPALVLIGGPSCAGKTALARALADEWGDAHACVLTLDSYYRDLGRLTLRERASTNFDAPDAIEWELAERHVRSLLRGETVQVPVYDFTTHARQLQCLPIEPKPLLVLDGLLALYHSSFLGMSTLRVFVDAPDEICLARREQRDAADRGRTQESVREQFEVSVRPMAVRYVRPTRIHADIVVDGAGTVNSMLSQVLTILRNHAIRGQGPPF